MSKHIFLLVALFTVQTKITMFNDMFVYNYNISLLLQKPYRVSKDYLKQIVCCDWSNRNFGSCILLTDANDGWQHNQIIEKDKN